MARQRLSRHNCRAVQSGLARVRARFDLFSYPSKSVLFTIQSIVPQLGQLLLSICSELFCFL